MSARLTDLVDWTDLGIAEAHVALRKLGWPVTTNGAVARLTLGAAEGDFAAILAVGIEGLETLDKLRAEHPNETHLEGPTFGRDGSRVVIVIQGARPVSSCELGDGVSILAHGSIVIPPSVDESLWLRWRRGREPDSVKPCELPSWLEEAAATLRRERAREKTPGNEWYAQLARTPNNKIRNTFANVCAVLRNAPEFGALRHNEMTLTPEEGGVAITDARLGAMREKIELAYGFTPAAESIAQGILTVSAERPYHPVREYLNRLHWDGRARIDTVCRDILNAEMSRINVTVVRAWFISAVARAMEPGCKVDNSLVLVGPQGIFKSTFFSILGGKWFADSAIDLESKDAMLQINHAWIYELAELDQVTSRAHAGRIKSFLSSQVDKYRPPYARTVASVPRGNVIVGSTNESQFLGDATGARRFWCVRVASPINRDVLERDRDQLWAEAVAAYRAREPWWLSAEAETAQREDSEHHAVGDPWEARIAEWVASAEAPVTTSRVLTAALSIEIGRVTQRDSVRVGAILRRLGWTNRVRRIGAQTHRVWETADRD
jgi:hypothetical protein